MFKHSILRSGVAVAFIAGVLTLAIPASARAQSPVSFSVVGGLSLPIGDLGNSTNMGFNVGMRGEGSRMNSGWSFRGDVSYDAYSGRGTVDNLSYLAAAGNLVHRTAGSKAYQFGGLGIYNSRVARTNTVDATDTNLGVQMGLGLDLTSDRRVFGELGLTSAFTSGRSSVWFPVRVGLRF